MQYDLADTYQNWIDKKNKGEQAEDVFDSMFCGFFNYVGDDPQYWPLDIDFASRENEAAFCPIYICTKCGKVIKSEDLSEKDYKKLCLTGETIKL